jgi:hypothetical protein
MVSEAFWARVAIRRKWQRARIARTAARVVRGRSLALLGWNSARVTAGAAPLVRGAFEFFMTLTLAHSRGFFTA